MPCVGGTHMESRWQLQGTDHKGVDQEFPGNKELDGGGEYNCTGPRAWAEGITAGGVEVLDR